MKNKEPKKTPQQVEFEELQKFMTEQVPTGSQIHVWNVARDMAKAKFSATAISMLDASGFINTLKMSRS